MIRKISPGGVVTKLAGMAGQMGYADGTGTAARFRWLGAIALDKTGNVYVGDNALLRKISPSGVVSNLAGDPEWDPLPLPAIAARACLVSPWV